MAIQRTWRRLHALVLAAGLLAAGWPGPVTRAADLPLYDVTLSRERVVPAASVTEVTQLYSDIPLYVELPGGTQSISTPNVVGDTLSQYTWDAAGNGWLWAVAMPQMTWQQVENLAQQQGTNSYAVVPAQQTAPPIRIAAGFTPGGLNEAAGQDSLSTGPYVDGQADGTQYQAIAVGENLYIWPASAYPTGGAPSGTSVFVKGNPGNTDYQIDESPLITPPVTVQGIDLSTGQPTTWQSPVAVVGSWDGGLVATPVYAPSGDASQLVNYQTSLDYSNSVAALTSDPTWVGAVPGVGQNCVAFGVAGAHPRVVVFDVTTGAWKDVGVGAIGAQIADATLYDPASGTLFAQDIYGGLYAFDLQTGALTGVYAPSSWTSTKEVLGQDMAWVPPVHQLMAIGGGGNVLGTFGPTLNVVGLSGAYAPGVASPAVVMSPDGNFAEFFSNAEGAVFANSPGGYGVLTIPIPPGSQYIGYQPDAGPDHALLGWTNRDPNGRPAFVLFMPTPYTVRASLSAPEVSSGQSVTITARPLPTGITATAADAPGVPNPWTYPLVGGPAPVSFEVLGPGGQVVQGWAGLTHVAVGVWQTTWTPPPNDTGQPVTYTIQVGATDNQGISATAPPLALTVEPTPPSGTDGGAQATLALQCGYGHGGLPIIVPHTCTIPTADQGEPATWFAYHPTVGAKFGDTIQATLTIPTPQLPALPGVQLTGVQLRASITHTAGTPNLPGYPGYNPGDPALYHYSTVTTPLTPSGGALELSATGAFVESWAGYPPPPGALGQTVWDGLITADWSAVVTYQYQQPVTHCTPSGTTQQCTTTWVTATGQFTEQGSTSAPLTVNGSDYFIIATPTGY